MSKSPADNLRTMKQQRAARGWTQVELAELTGTSKGNIAAYEQGKMSPSIKTYNQLAKAFGWSELTIDDTDANQPRTVKHYDRVEHEEMPAPIEIPKPPVFFFEVGREYLIDKAAFVLRYERKDGIHHMFRSVRGGWTQTFTDAQLIGKTIKEAGNGQA